MAKLTLSNTQELRDITSATMETYMTTGTKEDWISKAMKEQGQAYNDTATALKEEKRLAEENGTEPPDLAGLGPPHLHLWAAFVRAAGSQKDVDQQAVAYLKDSWENEINKAASVLDLGQ